MPIAFDTRGLQQLDQNRWGNPVTGDVVTLTYLDLVPDLPASLDDPDTLRRKLTELQAEFGCLIEAHAITVDGQPALLRLEKFPLTERSGLGFTAGIVVPKASCSAILKIQCVETGRSGVREAAVVPRVGFQNMFPPHPYAPEIKGKLPYNAADDARWDPQFPDHPLTRARAWVTYVSRTARIDPRFVALPPFTGPAAAKPSAAETVAISSGAVRARAAATAPGGGSAQAGTATTGAEHAAIPTSGAHAQTTAIPTSSVRAETVPIRREQPASR
ncbi:hypothetical protein NDR87_35500 [Nocardia sp. CDC159]|uniref:Uncharacterized protein n=1 Tax=Nocardia pulmonis TaxID=2951408 RepID=A0A9X2J1E3_9NOCA|nr:MULTISPECIES: hypothetical protein [Nocardia]MCM6778794.1 hypothetical protein [Nocardia pulmonis]MCM6791683.1 hypothetical protein [Nocardia sp. CDC159]